jgi:hypothetical protein
MSQNKFFLEVNENKVLFFIERLESSIAKYKACEIASEEQLEKLTIHLDPENLNSPESKQYWENEDCIKYWSPIRVESLKEKIELYKSELSYRRKSLEILRKIQSKNDISHDEQVLLEDYLKFNTGGGNDPIYLISS